MSEAWAQCSGSKLPGQSNGLFRKIICSEARQNQHGRAPGVRHGLEQTCVVPSTRGWWARGGKIPCAGGGFCCSVCVWAELAVGRVGRTWGRGALRGVGHGARAVGAPPPRVVTACGRGGLWLSSSSPRAVLSWIAHARLRVRSADLTCVRRASPRPRACSGSSGRSSSVKPPTLRRGGRVRSSGRGTGGVAGGGVAAPAGARVAAVRRFFLAMALVTRCVAREHGRRSQSCPRRCSLR